jgi:hypothetical protein
VTDAPTIVAALLALAVLAGWVRLTLWQRSAPAGDRSAAWRLALLMLAQPILALLAWFMVFPPLVPGVGGALIVATAGTTASAGIGTSGIRRIRLPEAGPLAGFESEPDLATALRRTPGVTRLIVLGRGLPARDIDAAKGWPLDFTPPPAMPGIVALTPPEPVAAGADFAIGGQVAGLAGARAELIDPAGRRVASAALDAQGGFALTGTTRTAGAVLFDIVVRSAEGRELERTSVPVEAREDDPLRVLVLAGAPGGEVRALRRWAADSGMTVQTRIAAGGGVRLGDEPIEVSAAALRGFDVAVVDDRAWNENRTALLPAVREGMGLILRASGPLDGGTRAAWNRLGIGLSGGSGAADLVLRETKGDAERRAARQGIGSEAVPLSLNAEAPLPQLARLAAQPGGSALVPLLADDAGARIAAWRSYGRGRIAVMTALDSYALILSGHPEHYGEWWSALLGAVARAGDSERPLVRAALHAGARGSVCGLEGDTSLTAPDGRTVPLLLDPLAGPAGCAAIWPRQPGWHTVNTATDQGRWPIWIRPAGDLPALVDARLREGTMRLAAGGKKSRASASQPSRGPAWPWFLGWLTLAAALWWFERSRYGRAVAAPRE